MGDTASRALKKTGTKLRETLERLEVLRNGILLHALHTRIISSPKESKNDAVNGEALGYTD